jgi:polyhydroxybutyrate depolymerase
MISGKSTMHRLLNPLVVSVILFHSSALAAPINAAAERTIQVDGLERHYLVFVPSKATESIPVVIALHGGGGNARQMERYTKFDDVGDKEGFIVIYPESVGGNWNDGRGVEFMQAQRENINDVKFVRLILDDMAKDHKIDRSRVFATGISNGGFMSHRLAAEASNMIAGIAPVVGGMAPAIAEKFKPHFPVSILIIQSDADSLVPIGGGDVVLGSGRPRGKVISTKEALAKYVERNGNHGDPVKTTLDADPNDATSVEITKFPDGPVGIKTWFYLVKNGGHTWPGRAKNARDDVIGKTSQEFSATDVIWDFFKSCPPRSGSKD